jgi:SAM-dependent methyltransferase
VTHGHIDYTIVDIEEAHVTTAQAEIAQWLRGKGYAIQEDSTGDIRVKDNARSVDLHFATADALALASESVQTFDGLVGQAFLDIVPLESGLTALFKALKPDGVFYFPINFDGISALLPVVDRARDTLVEEIFHRSMDERKDGRTGGSQTGRQLLEALPTAGAEIDAVGASDWIVRSIPHADSYPDDEEYFLRSILKFMHNELMASEDITSDEVATWYDQRRNQLNEGKLKYIAHQLDYTGRFVGI